LTLSPGSRLGPYEILAPLGAGGMGEVYRARDAKLGRDVAIKVLPEAFASDPARLARFRREAQVLATLNHPHIAAIYGMEESSGVEALVLELVEGDTLAERLARGRMPMDEVLEVARQIGDGLEAAHERGIVHRDLKPANVKITPDGKVKVLDFGLAKALSEDTSSPDVSHSPTLTAAATQAGVVIGTAAYMSPEQARGRAIDKRSDIWSFGVVLYEMLSGRRCFEGETVSDVLAAVLRQDPDWSALPPETPAPSRALLRRCLERDPKKRLRDIGDAWLETVGEPAPPVAPSPKTSAPAWLAAVVAALLAGFGVARWLAAPRAVPAAPPVHAVVPLPPGTELFGWASPVVAISRDGRTLAFVARKGGEPPVLWIHRLDRSETRVVPDSVSAEGPFFSDDGQWLAFATNVSAASATINGSLKKYSLATGLTQDISAIPDYFGGAWAADGSIAAAVLTTGGLWRFSAAGGRPDTSAETVLANGKPTRRALSWPQWLSTTEILVAEDAETPWGRAAVLDFPTRTIHDVETGVSFARYTADGRLLVARSDRTVLAAPFDPGKRQVKGPFVAVLRDVAFGCNGASALAVSDNGTLVYASGYIRGSGMDLARLVRITEKGEVTNLPFPPELLGRYPAPSPDGRSLAVLTTDGYVWIYELDRQVRRRLPLGDTRGQGWGIVWSPDGTSVAYTATSPGADGWSIQRQKADGSAPAETIVSAGEEQYPLAWTPDGREVIYTVFGDKGGLFALPVVGGGSARRLTAGLVSGASVSPDGRWIAYDWNDPEGWQSVIARLSGEGGRVVVAPQARFPRFSPDGRFVHYLQNDAMVRVPVRFGERPELGSPEVLFRTPVRGYSVAPDGRGFFLVVDDGDTGIVRELHLVTNWFSELERLAPAGQAK